MPVQSTSRRTFRSRAQRSGRFFNVKDNARARVQCDGTHTPARSYISELPRSLGWVHRYIFLVMVLFLSRCTVHWCDIDTRIARNRAKIVHVVSAVLCLLYATRNRARTYIGHPNLNRTPLCVSHLCHTPHVLVAPPSPPFYLRVSCIIVLRGCHVGDGCSASSTLYHAVPGMHVRTTIYRGMCRSSRDIPVEVPLKTYCTLYNFYLSLSLLLSFRRHFFSVFFFFDKKKVHGRSDRSGCGSDAVTKRGV